MFIEDMTPALPLNVTSEKLLTAEELALAKEGLVNFYQKVFPNLNINSFADMTQLEVESVLNPANEKILIDSVVKSINRLTDLRNFALKERVQPKKVHLQFDKVISRSGASCEIIAAEIDGKEVAAKVIKPQLTQNLEGFLDEAQSRKIYSDLNLGSEFYGITTTPDSRIVLLIEKIEGAYDIHDKGKYFVNGRTIRQFKQKMETLQQAGYTFRDDEGQMMIGENGDLFFVDINLSHMSPEAPLSSSYWYNENLFTLWYQMVRNILTFGALFR